MPELPEVEGFRSIARRSVGRTIERVEVQDPGLLKGLSPAALQRRLTGRRVRAAERYGKHLFLVLSDAGALEMHFGLNGSLALVAAGETAPRFTRIALHFTRGDSLAYVNPRRFGHLQLTKDIDAFVAEEGLGPDALDRRFDLAALTKLAARKLDIKGALMDQHLVAGIGNVWADEILYQARINPAASAASLDERTLARLFQVLKRTLEKAIAIDLERPPRSFLLSEREPGGHCPRCGTALAILRQRARASYYCPKCQPAP